MKTKFTHELKMFFFLLFFSFSNFSNAANCNEYIQQLSNGDIRFSVTFPVQKAYVEIFASKNGQQHLAANIVGSQVINPDGTYSYSYSMPASFYATGNQILVRFYSYSAGGPGIFTPGPSEGVWSQPFFYNQTTCSVETTCNDYIQQAGNGDITFSVTFPTQKAYVEVFASKNGAQNIASNITGSQVINGAEFTYSYTVPASTYATGDKILARFYSYSAGGPGIFTPGPSEGVWSDAFYFNQTSCVKIVHVSVSNGNDANAGTSTSPLKTIKKGITMAIDSGASTVKVATGTYYEGNISDIDGLNILGGFSTDFSTRDITFNSNVTTIDAYQTGTGYYNCGSARVFTLVSINVPTVIEGFKMTNGRLCAPGGGIYIYSCSKDLIIRNNIITDNSSVGRGTSAGGNIYMVNSSAHIYNNQIINGFVGGGTSGADLYMAGMYAEPAEVNNNVFTYIYSVVGIYSANYHDNTYLYSARTGRNANEETIQGGKENNAVSIAPNPTNGNVTIDLSNMEAPESVTIYSVLGATVYENASIQNVFHVDLSAMNKGLYFVVIKHHSGVLTKRLVVE